MTHPTNDLRETMNLFTDSHLRLAAIEYLRPIQEAKLLEIGNTDADDAVLVTAVASKNNKHHLQQQPQPTSKKRKTNKELKREEDDEMFWRTVSGNSNRSQGVLGARVVAKAPAPVVPVNRVVPAVIPSIPTVDAERIEAETETESDNDSNTSEVLLQAASSPAKPIVPAHSSSLASSFMIRRGITQVASVVVENSELDAVDVVPPTPAPLLKRPGIGLKPRKRFNASDFLDSLF
ncbi:hypothetical protein BDR26DRAFT_932464 [Obelidium mucronatum]|nr:hypothetical protein BDR26DRAFT_932464 [Obelidium mucronatum]